MNGVSRTLRFPELFLMLLVTASWFVQMTFPVQSFDFYYHIATGRWIVDNSAIPTHDVFSTSASGARWITHEWASQVALYAAYRVVGINGLIVFKSIWLSAVAVLAFILGRRLGSSPAWTALLVSLAAPAVAFRAFLRPHVLSHGLLILLLYIVYTESPRKPLQRRVVLAGLFLLWGNCHSAFVFGLFVLGVKEFFTAFNASGLKLKTLKESSITVGIAACAALVNPNTWRAYSYPFKFMMHPELFELVSELRPIHSAEFQGGWFIPIVYGFMLCAAFVFLARLRAGSMPELLLLFVFSALALKSVRNVPNLVLVLLPGLFLHGGALLQSISRRFTHPLFGFSAVAGAAALPVFLGSVVLTDGIPTDRVYRRQFGTGVRDLNYPKGAVDYLKTHAITGKYFNTFAFGGYFLWALYPDPGVFIDGRLFVFAGDVLNSYSGVLNGRVELDDLASRYGVTHLVLSYPESPIAHTAGLYAELLTDRTWVPVFWDDNTMIFVREGTGNDGLLQSEGYRILHPLRRTLPQIDEMISANPAEAFREAERGYRDYPGNSGSAVILGRFYALRGQYLRAVEYYRKTLEKHPENSVIRQQKALGLMEIGLFDEAEQDWLWLLSRSNGDGFILMNLGITLHRQGKGNAAFSYYQAAWQTGFRSAELMNGIGIHHAESGDLQKAVDYWKRGLALKQDHVQIRANLERAEMMMKAAGD